MIIRIPYFFNFFIFLEKIVGQDFFDCVFFLNFLNELFFCSKGPAIGKAVHSVAEEAQVLPVGLDGPGFSLAKWIGVVGELVGFGFP